MRFFFLILSLFAVSCASVKKDESTVVLDQHLDYTPKVCETVTTAINEGDWNTLRMLVKPGMRANEYITLWANAKKTGHAVQVGRLLNVETVAGTSRKPYKLYSFSLENKDGTVNPHWLQIKVGEAHGWSEILDFWNFGW